MKKLRTKKKTKWQYLVLYFDLCVPDFYYNVRTKSVSFGQVEEDIFRFLPTFQNNYKGNLIIKNKN